MQWKLAVPLALVSAGAFAEEGVTTGSFPVERRNVVTVSVPLQSLNQLSLEGERVMGEHFSVGLGVFASFTDVRSRFDEVQPGGVEGFDSGNWQLGLSPSVRFYLTGRAPQGLWVSPHLDVAVGRTTNETVVSPEVGTPPDNEPTKVWSVGGAAVVGYSVVLEPGFTVQGGVGFGARREALAYDSLTGSLNGGLEMKRIHQHAWLLTQRILLNVGWAF
ncbi:autotransporter outer membrane beta-barrel domain-containing protein [Corallococcus sp. EGB]|uniref:autotransporter outer membrane beta-barrel domain-containing protein n=1 Tax=Corallococcus sp. EGB TaxID=1521117 RepID=UPI001CBE54D0|nr:autotransporter outer membrane beta-barrel domain-containing protein [Corallococcus sp. EGB]